MLQFHTHKSSATPQLATTMALSNNHSLDQEKEAVKKASLAKEHGLYTKGEEGGKKVQSRTRMWTEKEDWVFVPEKNGCLLHVQEEH